MAKKKHTIPIMELVLMIPSEGLMAWNAKLIGMTTARMRFASALDAVVLRLVPNISAVHATNKAEYPLPNPIAKRTQ